MRFLFYFNLIAIVLLAGALAQIYDGKPLAWLEGPASHALGPVAANDSWIEPEVGPEDRLQDEAPLDAGDGRVVQTPDAAALSRLHLPVPNPQREVAAALPEPRQLTLLTEGAYPPFNYRDDKGDLTGFDIDIARALCKRLSADCTFQVMNWSALMPSLLAGKADAIVASVMKPLPGRAASAAKGVIFTSSYYATPGHFAARRDDVPTALTKEALSDKKIAVQAGSVHRAFLARRFAGFNVLEVSNLEAGKVALASGKADLLFADRNALLQWTASRKATTCCRLVGSDYSDAAFFGEGAGIVLRAGDVSLRDELNKALAAIIADGTYAAISSHYFNQSIY